MKVPFLRSLFFKTALAAGLLATATHAQVSVTSIVSAPGGTAISVPEASYVDPYGNIFVANTTGTSILEIPANGSAPITIISGLASIRGVAADHAGNVYVAQISVTTILKVPANGGATSTLGNGIGRPFNLTMDAQDNLYVTDSSNARILKIVPSTGVQTALAFTGLVNTHGVAIDSAGDVFATSFTGTPEVTELSAGGVQTALPFTGITNPYGIAVDSQGRLDIIDGGTGRLLQYSPPFTAASVPVVLASALGTAASSVSLAPNGDIVYNNTTRVYALQSAAANYFGTAVLATSTASALTFTFASAKTLGAPIYTSNNATIPAFKDGGTDTCTSGKAVAAPGTCLLNVVFAPMQEGQATGTVTLVDNTGVVLATVNLTGTGYAPLPVFTSGTQSNFVTALGTPAGVAVDAGGNVYTADQTRSIVTKTTAAGVTTTLAFTGLSRPVGVAVDGAGAVYVADSVRNSIFKLSSAGVQTTFATGLNAPLGIALDGSGNLYVANSGTTSVIEISNAGIQTTLPFTGLTGPAWVTVDPTGDVFVSDSGHVFELAVGNTATMTVATPSLGTAAGLAVGANGTLYIADSTKGDVLASGVTLGSGIAYAAGLALAPSGALYVASSTGGTVVVIDRTKQTLTFPSTAQGATSTAMTATVQNAGNAILTLSGLAVSAGFQQVTPLAATDCTATSTVAAAATCNVNITFSPIGLGASTGTVTLTDNALNATAATQTINLTGGATRASTVTVAQTVPATGNAIYGQSVGLTATVAATTGASTPTPTGSVTFTIDGTTSVAMMLSNGQVTDTATNLAAGSHTVYSTYSGDPTYAGSTSATTTFTVAPAVLTVSGSSQTRTYGTANAALTYTITGFVYSDTSAVVSGSATVSTSATTTSDPGSYPVTVSVAGLSAANYTFSAVAGSIVVTKASSTITFPPLAAKTYGAAPQALAATSSSGLAVQYSIVSGPGTANNGATPSVTINGAGTIVVAANQAGNADYSAAAQVTQSFTVTAAVLTVTANNLSKQQGQANPTLTYAISGFVNGDPSTVVSGTPSLTTTATTASPSGSYPITISKGSLAAANYTFTFVNGALTVTGGTAQTITFGALPNVTYGTGPITLAATASSGLAVTYTITGPATLNGNTVSVTGVGMVSVTANQSGNGTYAAAPAVTQSFIVAPATLTVATANATRQINTPNPAFTYTISGFVNGDPATVVTGTPSFSTTATQSSPVGTYPITTTQGTLAAANYVFTFGTASLTVTPTPQAITFGALPGLTYGASPVTLTATASSGLAVTYTVTGPATVSGSTLTITGAGLVTITAAQAGNATYAAATSVVQSFTVAPAPLTVTANNATIVFGSPIPTTFAYAITGFVNGDSASVVSGAPAISTTATSSSPGGMYPITPTQGTLVSANYVFATFVPGILTITSIPQTITFAALPNIPQTTATVTLIATASSGLPVVFANVTGPATLSGNVLTITGPGVVSVTATQSGNSSYAAATPVTQSFTVLATTTTALTLSATVVNQGASVLLTAKVTSKIAGTPTGNVTFSIAGVQIGSPALLVSGAAMLTTTTLPAGSLNIIATYSGDTVFSPSVSGVATLLVGAPDFNISATPTNLTITSGQTGTTTITVTPLGGYAQTINFSCSNLPANLECSFAPPAVNFYPGTGTLTQAQSTVLTLTAAALAAQMEQPAGRPIHGIALAGLFGGLPLLALVFFRDKRKKLRGNVRLTSLCILLLAGAATATLSGCGTSPASTNAAPGTYNIAVNLNDGSTVTHTLTLTVTIQ